jgi:YVTN family beta-propeller protein
MRKIFFLPVLIFFSYSRSQTYQQLESKRVDLPNGWSLTPVGKSLPLGDLPLNMAVSSSKKLIAVTNNGQSVQSLQLIDAVNDKMLSTVEVKKAWYGLKFSADGKFLYASGGHDNWILKYAVANNKLVLKDSIKLGDKWPNKIAPAGIEMDDAKKILYVVTMEDNSLYIVSLADKKVKNKIPLDGEAYTCQLSPDKKRLYISCWGCDKLMVFDTDKQTVIAEIKTGDNPNEICMTRSGKFLYVANANDNSVSVINTTELKVVETLNTALTPGAPPGSTANGLALSADEKTLYAANADNNCLAVFDIDEPGFSHNKGFIPIGWYPTNIKVIGKKVFVTNGKGFSSKPNAKGPNPTNKKDEVSHQQAIYDAHRSRIEYIGGLFKGTMTIFNEPDYNRLAAWSQVTYNNTPYNKDKSITASGEPGNPIPMKVGEKSPIKYVFYVIKENRTYDQVLSDVPGGNGDTSLLLFGERITPNQHKLAKEFVLLDNFYVDGEVSADGHNWSLGAYATDFLEKTWPTNYGGRGGSYNAEGTREIANNKGGFIWDHCKKAGVTFRTYGEFADDYKANIPVLEGNFCPYYTSWDETVRDTTRFFQWKREFDSLLAKNAVPQFNSLRLINDHTEGLRKGRPTPFAHVADNDLAVGMFVEYLSKSPIWKETAIFIVEDDAQNGPDHVDAHRTTAYVAGGFVKRKFTDHTMYSTSSMLRTIELILGIPPMTQYDAAAEPMWRCFTSTADLTPFTSLPSNIDLNEKNAVVNKWQQKSETFDFTKEDAAPDLEFSEVIWYAVKGEGVPFPGPRRSAFLKVKTEKDDDD